MTSDMLQLMMQLLLCRYVVLQFVKLITSFVIISLLHPTQICIVYSLPWQPFPPLQQVSGSLKLLISHRQNKPMSGPSELSSHSGSTQPSPIYDEIIAPSGYRVGEPKCIIIRKVS